MPSPQFLDLSGPKAPPRDGARPGHAARTGAPTGKAGPEAEAGARSEKARAETRDWAAALEGGTPRAREETPPVADTAGQGAEAEAGALFALPGLENASDLPAWLRDALAAQEVLAQAPSKPALTDLPTQMDDGAAVLVSGQISDAIGKDTGDAAAAARLMSLPTGDSESAEGEMPPARTGAAQGKLPGGITESQSDGTEAAARLPAKGLAAPEGAPQEAAPTQQSAGVGAAALPVPPGHAFGLQAERPQGLHPGLGRSSGVPGAASPAPASGFAGAALRTGVETATAVTAPTPTAPETTPAAGFPATATFDLALKAEGDSGGAADFAEILARSAERTAGSDALGSAGKPPPVALADLKLSLAERVAALSPAGTDGDPRVQASGPRTAEVELAPGDLGRLRLLLQTGERGLHLVVAVERPEMVETVRRHLDGLHRALLAEGVTLDSVDIGSDRGRSAGEDRRPDTPLPAHGRAEAVPVDAPDMPARAARPALRDGRLDLSL